MFSKLNDGSNKQFSYVSTIGKIAIGITGSAAIILTAICVPFVSPALRKYCLPYVPATDIQLRNVLLSLRNCTGNLIDLGSGDGRIVIEAAKQNFVAHGVELNLWLMPRLEKKILTECKDKSNIIACRFPLPNLQPKTITGSGIDTVWLYTINKTKL